MAEWLCSGLQSRLRRFDSGFSLQKYENFSNRCRLRWFGDGVCLSSFGHRVTILDKNNSKIRSLTKGNSIIFEKDLPELLRKQLKKKKLLLTSSYDDVAQNDVFIICVDTPFINKKPYKKILSTQLNHYFQLFQMIH